MSDLTDYRTRLNEVDDELSLLFAKRMGIIREIALFKTVHHLNVFQPGREAQVISRALQSVKAPEDAPYVKDFFEQLLRISKECQAAFPTGEAPEDSLPAAQGPIAFPGAQGSFSQQAAAGFFGKEQSFCAHETFEGALRALAEGDAAYAVLPIENSSAGAVSETYDLLTEYSLFIVGEQVLPVAHQLLGIPGSTLEGITEVYSHPQALAQCRDYLAANPHMRKIPSLNTALAARDVALWKDPRKAAIASSYAAELYGLAVLKENIHGLLFNTTRFVVVSRDPAPLRDADKATVTFSLSNERGTLARTLSVFADHGVSLSKIESRPIPAKPWEYIFYADFEGPMSEEALQKALKAAAPCVSQIRLLGRYGKAK